MKGLVPIHITPHKFPFNGSIGPHIFNQYAVDQIGVVINNQVPCISSLIDSPSIVILKKSNTLPPITISLNPYFTIFSFSLVSTVALIAHSS